MAWPASLTLVTVAIQFDLPPSGGNAPGWLDFTMAQPLQGGADNSIVPSNTWRAIVATDGSGSIQLPATNDPQWSPTDWAYTVRGRIGTAAIAGTLQLDYQTASVQLADLLQVDGAAVAGTSYLLTAQRSVASGVAGLDADGDVIDAAGNKITGGESSGIPATIVNAKGDLIAGTADNAVARQAVGTDGQVLTVDSGSSTGLSWTTPTEGGGGSTITIARGYVTTGDVNAQTTASWAALTSGPTFAIAAAVGDRIEFDWAGLRSTVTGLFWDPAVLVGGAPVRYASSGTSSPSIEGDPSLYPDLSFRPSPGLGMAFTATADDISGGNVTVGFAVINPSGGGKLFASTNYPLRYRLINYGS